MIKRTISSLLTLLLVSWGTAQVPLSRKNPPPAALDTRLGRFDVNDAIVRNALSELTLQRIDGLHLGFEEIIRARVQDDPRILSEHFSLHLRDKTVKDVLDAVCAADPRYTWSQDGSSLNVYPRQIAGDQTYLMNLKIEHLDVRNVPDPDQALSSLAKLFPEQQVGYFGPGLGDNTYSGPWTTTFDHLTVRQFANRIAEHMGQSTAWVWEGGTDQRMFTFVKDGFNVN